jgi:hypothetical protein
MIHSEVGIASAGTNDDAGGDFGWAGGRVKGERRLILVCRALCAGCAIGPKENGFWRALRAEKKGQGKGKSGDAKRKHFLSFI